MTEYASGTGAPDVEVSPSNLSLGGGLFRRFSPISYGLEPDPRLEWILHTKWSDAGFVRRIGRHPRSLSNEETRFMHKNVGFAILIVLSFLPALSRSQETPESEPSPSVEEAERSETRSTDEERESTEESPSVVYRVEDGEVVVRAAGESVRRLESPCDAREASRDDETLYVACGAKGVYLYSLDEPRNPKGIGFRQMDGTVDGLFQARNRVWAEILRTEARPVGELDAADVKRAPVPEQSEQMEAETEREPEEETTEKGRADEGGGPSKKKETDEARPEGRVVAVRKRSVVVDLGRSDGLERGDAVEIYRRERVELGGESADREITEVVGEVETTSENRSVIALGINESARADRFARPTDLPLTANVVAPPRPEGQSSLSFMARPLLPLDALGGGVVAEAAYQYNFEWPGTAEVRVDPMSLVVAEQRAVFPGALSASMSYDTTIFRLGFGAGLYKLSDRTIGAAEPTDQNAAFDLTQIVRLGARDGLNFRLRNSFLVVNRQFQYGGTRGEFQVSMTNFLNNTWMVVRGGTHSAGQGLGELGLRVLTSGNGTEGSTFLTATVGAAGLWGELEGECPDSRETDGTCIESHSYLGPVVGFGIERRF